MLASRDGRGPAQVTDNGGEPRRLRGDAGARATIVSMSETKHLFVLRHAKSSWDDPGQDDHDRPLAPRGRRAVAVLAEYLVANEIRPAQVLCSTSRRTRETMEGIGVGGEHLVERELYGASSRSSWPGCVRFPTKSSR